MFINSSFQLGKIGIFLIQTRILLVCNFSLLRIICIWSINKWCIWSLDVLASIDFFLFLFLRNFKIFSRVTRLWGISIMIFFFRKNFDIFFGSTSLKGFFRLNFSLRCIFLPKPRLWIVFRFHVMFFFPKWHIFWLINLIFNLKVPFLFVLST